MINRRGNTRIEWYDVDVLLWGSIVPPSAGTGPRYWDVWGEGPRGQRQQPYLDLGASGLYVRKLWATQIYLQENYTSGVTSGLHGGFHTQVSGLYPASGFNLATKAYVDYMITTVSGGGGGSTSLSGLTDVSGVWSSGMVVSWDGSFFVPAMVSGGGGVSSSGNWEISGSAAALALTLPALYAASGVYLTQAQADIRYAWSGTGGVASSGNWEISGTSASLDAGLPARFQASGLYETSGTSYTKAESNTRFAASGIFGDITGTGTSGQIARFDANKHIISDQYLAYGDIGGAYGLTLRDPLTGGGGYLVPDYYALGLNKTFALPTPGTGFGCFLVGSQVSGVTGSVPYYSEASILSNSDWMFTTANTLSGANLLAISGTFQKLSVRGQDTDTRYALSGTGSGSGTTTLSGCTDVLYNHALTSGEVLSYNGTKWTNATAAAGDSDQIILPVQLFGR